jgi:phospholipase/lecithinase/hemolysin
MKPFLAVAVLALALNGCAARVAHVTNLPAGVTEQQAKNYDAAVAGLHKIAATNSALRKSLISLRGVFDDRTYGITLLALAKIDEAELSASAYLRDAPEYFGDTQKQRIADIFSNVANQIQALNTEGITGIKDPETLKQVNGLISELTAGVNLVIALTQ